MQKPAGTSRVGPRLSNAAAKSLTAAVSLIILVSAVVAVVAAVHGALKWTLLVGVIGVALADGAYHFGKSRLPDMPHDTAADLEGGSAKRTTSITVGQFNAADVSQVPYRLYDLSTEAMEEEYYRVLAESIRRAQTIIYRSGRGFFDEPRKRFKGELISAEDFALGRGVKIIRVQTADRVSPDWAEQYASLIEKYPDKLVVYADLKDPLLVNLGLIDPQGPRPEVQILFESVTAVDHPSHTADAGIFVYGPSRFARSLQAQFEHWTNGLRILDADQVRNLARTYLYFAYGSNMSLTQMRERCPGAVRRGTGILYGWKRNFSVAARHLGATAAAAGLERSDNPTDCVEGVVYDLTVEEKRSIDEIEAGGYAPVDIDFKLAGRHVSGFTHIPENISASARLKPTRAYLQLMIEGAEANGLVNLAKQLRLMHSGER